MFVIVSFRKSFITVSIKWQDGRVKNHSSHPDGVYMDVSSDAALCADFLHASKCLVVGCTGGGRTMLI